MTGIALGSAITITLTITLGSYFIWSWANDSLFTYLGEADINGVMESCYTYDLMTLPARIVCFLCGCAAIAASVISWFWLASVIF